MNHFMKKLLSIAQDETKKSFKEKLFEALMRIEGVEPPRREAPDPKSGVSTNSTISAVERQIYESFLKKKGGFYKKVFE